MVSLPFAVGSHLAHHLAAPEPTVAKLFHQLMSSTHGNGNPLQCSCLENPTDGEAW